STDSTSGASRHSRRTPWPTMPVAPNRRTFMAASVARNSCAPAARRAASSRRAELDHDGDLGRADVGRLLGADLPGDRLGAASERAEAGAAGRDVHREAVLVDLERQPQLDGRGRAAGARGGAVAALQ